MLILSIISMLTAIGACLFAMMAYGEAQSVNLNMDKQFDDLRNHIEEMKYFEKADAEDEYI